MDSQSEQQTKEKRLSIKDIGFLYKKSPTAVRNKIKIQKDAKEACQAGSGPHPDQYKETFVARVFGAELASPLTDAPMNIFAKGYRKSAEDKRFSAEHFQTPESNSLSGILNSRKEASDIFNTLLLDQIENGEGLRIRVITGTDFFNAHRPTSVSFSQRVKNGLSPTEILLVHPYERGALLRSAAEGDSDIKTSQFLRDAISTFAYIRDNEKNLQFVPKWGVDLPYSLLVWTQAYALIESYDFGRRDREHSGCIGRSAPMLVVRGETDYHRLLMDGFDYIFDGDEKATHIKTHSLKEVSKAYERNAR